MDDVNAQAGPYAAPSLAILCVEDDPDNAYLERRALERDRAITTKWAADGTQAITILQQGWKPDCILLDFRLPKTTGAQLLAEIRQLPGHERTPVIFITATPRDAKAAASDPYVRGIISKPFDLASLPILVRQYLGG